MGYRHQPAARCLEGVPGGASTRIGSAGEEMRQAVIATLRFYKRFISPFLPSASRFSPTCSEYMLEAGNKYSALRGGGMGLRRLLRWHPFHAGPFHPVR